MLRERGPTLALKRATLKAARAACPSALRVDGPESDLDLLKPITAPLARAVHTLRLQPSCRVLPGAQHLHPRYPASWSPGPVDQTPRETSFRGALHKYIKQAK